MTTVRRTGGRPKGASGARPGTTTTFGHAVVACGMTLGEAASYLDVSLGSARAYALGTRTAPPAILDRIAELWEQVSFRRDPGVLLPYPAAKRREALHDLRTRSWRRQPEPEPVGRSYDDIDGLE